MRRPCMCLQTLHAFDQADEPYESHAQCIQVFAQNLVLLLKLPEGRLHARGLLVTNLLFSGLGVLLTVLLSATSWQTLHKKSEGGSLKGRVLCGQTLRMVNFTVALCSIGVTITSSALGSFVIGDEVGQT